MRVKYILHIGDTDYELREDDLANWGETSCSYKREDYGGVVRSFTSKFEFVNRAKELLMAEYLANRFNGQAKLSILTQNDNFSFDEQFSCQLDFSTIEWEGYKLKLSCIDDSLAALIKAEKGTKYEFEVGKDIESDKTMVFQRIPMQESVTYEFTQGDPVGKGSAISVEIPNGGTPWMGVVGDEVYVNGVLHWNDDQTDEANAYILRATQRVKVRMSYTIKLRSYSRIPGGRLIVNVKDDQSDVARAVVDESDDSGPFIDCIGTDRRPFSFRGEFPDLYTLKAHYPSPIRGWEAIVNGDDVYIAGDVEDPENIYGTVIGWKNSGLSAEKYYARTFSGVKTVTLNAGEMLYIGSELSGRSDESDNIVIIGSSFKFEWTAQGNAVTVPVMTPENIGRTLLNRIAGNSRNISVVCEGDRRLSQTYVMAAESIRGISGAKLYTSFNEFCEWMSVVFGYVYSIENPEQSPFKYIRECGLYIDQCHISDFMDEPYAGPVKTDQICYIERIGLFVYEGLDSDDPNDEQDIEEGRHELYRIFPGSENYNGANGHPRTDTLFKMPAIDPVNPDKLYYFNPIPEGEEDNEQYYSPNVYHFDASAIGQDMQTVRFFHRSELFGTDDKRVFRNVRDLKYSVDTSVIYSSIEVGYNKQDYNSVNGRDEFNFNNTYSTGCSVSDKKLSLISKYRADSYGIEFAAQERGKDSTDSSSDKDVFFAYCVQDGHYIKPGNPQSISGVLSGNVFNGVFSPRHCINANAGLIGLQADNLLLSFASTTGNANAVIGGESVIEDVQLGQSFATNGIIEFATDEIEDVPVNRLVEVTNDGITYQGYLKEVDVKYAREEAAKYKLIVKSIIL